MQLVSLYEAARNLILPSLDYHHKESLAQTQHEVTTCRHSPAYSTIVDIHATVASVPHPKDVSDLQGALIDRRHTQVYPCNLWLETQQDGALTQPQSALVSAVVLKQVWRALSSRELSVLLLLLEP